MIFSMMMTKMMTVMMAKTIMMTITVIMMTTTMCSCLEKKNILCGLLFRCDQSPR